MPKKRLRTKAERLADLAEIPATDKRALIGAKEFARRMAVDPSKIKLWEKAGYISRNPDGRFIWPQCRKDLEARKTRQIMPSDETNAPRVKPNPPAKGKAAEPSEPPTEFPIKKPPINISRKDLRSAELVGWLVAAIERMDGTALSGTYQFAKTFEQLLKVEKAQTAMLVERGELIERKAVEDTLAEAQRHKRNVWMNTPERIAVEFAEEAGIDRRLAYDLLTKHVQATLELIAEGAEPVAAKVPPPPPSSDEDELLLSQPAEADVDESMFEEGGHDE